MAVRGEGASRRLVGYVVPVAGETTDRDDLAEFVSRLLPAYMVPSVFVVLGELPLGPSGKLDRKALPAPVFEAREFRAPGTVAEQIVASVFAEVLGVERVGLDDDFFGLGGNSLIATQAVSRIGELFGGRVALRALFEASTVAALAAVVESSSVVDRVPLVAGPRPPRVPLSLAQQRMWFLNRFDPESAVNNIPVAVHLSGRLDIAALELALRDVVARHESLRTIYPDVDGYGFQKVLDPSDVSFDIRPTVIASEQLPEELRRVAGTGFDVARDVPMVVRLFETGPDAHVLVAVLHHIAADGFSMVPLTRDIMVAYAARSAGQAPSWAPLAVQYADYTLWQREVLGSEDDPDSLAAKEVEFWSATLADLPDRLDLPTDRPRPAEASGRGATVEFEIDAAVHEAVVALGRATGSSPFMVVHAALAVLLSRLSATSDIAIGAPVAGRGEQALDDLIGMFVNTLVLRTAVSPEQSFAEVLEQVREADIDAFAHAELPFERIVEVLDPVRSPGHHPLFQVALFFQNMAQPGFALAGLDVAPVDLEGSIAKFDLQLTVVPVEVDGKPAGMRSEFTYATDLFDEATVVGLADRLVSVLSAVVDDVDVVVGDLELASAVEVRELTVGVNDTAYPVGSATLLSRYRSQVERAPGATAVVFEGESLTYAQFDARVNRLARYLVAMGVGPETLVALGIRRSPELVVAMYAVVAAGGAYVPLDPDHPADRIGHILETADPICVLSTTADARDLPEGARVVLVARRAEVLEEAVVALGGAARADAQPGHQRVHADRMQPASSGLQVSRRLLWPP